MNIKEFKEVLPYAFEAGLSVIVHGQHGIGKSQVVKQFAKENGLEFIDRRLSQMEAGDLIGLPDVSGDVTQYKTPSWLPRDPDSKGILFLDELNRARRDVLQGVFQLVLDRSLGDYVLPSGWHIVSAVNPNTDAYVVTDVEDKALQDRFFHVKLTPTTEEFFAYQRNNPKVDQQYMSFLQLNETHLEDSTLSAFSIDKKGSRRSNEAVGRILAKGLPEHLIMETMTGLVGIAAATNFLSWKVENNVFPFTGDEVFEKYSSIDKKVKEYTDPASGNMRHDIIKQTTENVYEYAMKNYQNIKPTNMDNLVAFLNDIPKDIKMSLLIRFADSSSTDEQAFVNFVLPFFEDERTDDILEPKDYEFLKKMEEMEKA